MICLEACKCKYNISVQPAGPIHRAVASRVYRVVQGAMKCQDCNALRCLIAACSYVDMSEQAVAWLEGEMHAMCVLGVLCVIA
jgi:hypothetical protein